MAESVTINADTPRLEGVLGPLTPANEAQVRSVLLAASRRLVDLGRALGGRAGWHGGGLELEWVRSGQLSIGCAVEAWDADGHAVAFSVELRPGWFYGVPQEEPRWIVALGIDVDCQHSTDHETMEPVFATETAASSAPDAAAALARAVDQLVEQATTNPVEYWTAQARD
jgi:hypothetical protein